MIRRLIKYPIPFCLLISAAMPCRAQDQEADLNVETGGSGVARVRLLLLYTPPDAEAVKRRLETVLGGPLLDAKIEPRRTSRYRRWTLTGISRPALRRDGFVVRGTLAPSALIDGNNSDLSWITLTFSHPRTPGMQIPPDAITQPSGRRKIDWYVQYYVPRDHLPVIEFTFGYPTTMVFAAFAAVFIAFVLPFAISLRVRAVALRNPPDNREGNWFGYWRFLNGIGACALVIWFAVLGVFKLDDVIYFAAARYAGSGAWIVETAAWFGPPLLLMTANSLLAYPVFERVRENWYTPAEYAQIALLSVGLRVVPLVFFVFGVHFLMAPDRAPVGVILLVMTYVSLVSLNRAYARAADVRPQSLTIGELRDRIFVLAAQCKVKIEQIYVIPAGKGRMANAFASSGNTVLLTDYLLQHMSKREVDAVVAHELTHLRRQHPKHLFWALVSVFLFPAFFYFFDRDFIELGRWAVLAPVGILAGMPIFYAVSRRFEWTADAGAVKLTNDPKALSSALAKLARLNLVPLDWSRHTERMLTHPSMTRRIEAIAKVSGVPVEQLTAVDETAEPEDRYPLPPIIAEKSPIFATEYKARAAFRNSWIMIGTITVIPAVCVALIGSAGADGWTSFVVSLLITTSALIAQMNWIGLWGYAKQERLLRERLANEGIILPPTAEFVAMSPADRPRLFEGFYDWDIGFLVLSGGKLIYLGAHSRFELSRDKIESVRLGTGPPVWLRSPRVYIAWRRMPEAPLHVFNLRAADVGTLIALKKAVNDLENRIEAWHAHVAVEEANVELPALGDPANTVVTSASPKKLLRFRTIFGSLIFVELVAAALCVLFQFPFDPSEGGRAWILMSVVGFVYLLQFLPYVFYREPKTDAGSTVIQAAALLIQRHQDEFTIPAP